MIFEDEKTQQLNKAIKSRNLKEALIIIGSGMQTSKTQELKLFELTEDCDIFQTMNEILQEGHKISDKYLALASIYFNAKYFWDVGVGTDRGEQNKYPLLVNCYAQKIEDSNYCRTLFLEWKSLFEDMINQKTIYKDDTNQSNFYYWPHDYEEYVIEKSAFILVNTMFKEAKKEEILQIIADCKKYPKIPKAKKEIDKLYNQQNSRYYDVRYFSTWLSKNALTIVKKEDKEEKYKNIPLVSQGLIQEIKLIHKELIENEKLLEPQDILIIKKLYSQRIPELLAQYENFDHKNFGELKNNKNQNASELLFKSLSEVHSMFDAFNDKISIKKVENLSFHVRLTKEFIKHSF